MIILDSVTKKFGAFAAVDNVSYTIQKGESFALLGPNGAGKTTIVRMLLDFIKPSSGSIKINGLPASVPESRKHIGYIAEQHMIPPYLSGVEYLSRHASLKLRPIPCGTRCGIKAFMFSWVFLFYSY